MAKRVALIGLSFRFPSTDSLRYWPDLLQGRDLVTEIDPDRWATATYHHPLREHPGTAYSRAAGSLGDVSGFDAAFFGISPREAGLMDPQQRILLELAWEAMENAAIKPSSLRGSDCGVYIGIASADYSYRMAEDLGVIDASFATGNTNSIAANRLSYTYDLRGPSMAVDTACSSSLVAFHQACRAIESGDISQALAGGISLHLHPYGFLIFSKASMLSRQGRCNVFDAAGDGYVRSEGGGLFMLKDYDLAVADGDRILAVVAGTGVNTDGRKSGLTVPSADAQATLLRQAYDRAGILPEDVDYLEAHGTGTPVGDPIETRAIGMALGQRRPAGKPLPIGSIKSNMGHLEAASGVAGLVKAVYSLQHRTVPATIGVRELNPAILADEWNIDIVTRTHALPATGRLVIGVNSFGFGGANAHVILHTPDAQAPARPAAAAAAASSALPLIVSARTPQALKAAARDLAEHLQTVSGAALYDVAHQAALKRDLHEHRALAWCADRDEAADLLRRYAEGEDSPAVQAAEGLPDPQGPVFVYSGNGSQWAGMGRRLLDDPAFRQAIDEVDALFAPLAGYRLADELAGQLDGSRYARTEFAQPALFALQVGVTRMLAGQGVRPRAVVGHSVGEVAAAWACGALSLADAVQVIHHRSRLQGETRGSGQMTAIGVDGASAQALLAELGLAPALVVAGYNSSRGATIAGSPAALAQLEAALQQRGAASKRLDLDYAFHSPAMDGLAPALADALGALRPLAPSCDFYSAVTGARLADDALDADYWWRNIRQPVRFEQALTLCVADGYNLFVEVGPHAVLRGYVSDALKRADRPGRVLATITRGEDEPRKVASAAAQAILSGVSVDWRGLFPTEGRPHALPAYPWQRERHWYPDTPQSLGLLHRHRVHPLLGYRLAQHELTWENQLDTHSHPELADHVVGEATVFPGAGFVEIALAAALERRPDACVELENLEIHTPLLLAAAPSKLLRCAIEPEDGRLRILARELGSDDAWTRHVTARVRPEPGAALLTTPMPALPDRQADFGADDHAALTAAFGLHYGPSYRLVEQGWRLDPSTLLARLHPCAQETPGHLEPARLDSAFQMAVHLLEGLASMGLGMAFVPARIGRLALRTDAGQPRYAQLRVTRRSPHALTVDIALYAEDGAQVAALSEVSLRGIRLIKKAEDRLSFIDEALTPRPRPDGAAAAPLPRLRQALSEALEKAAQDPGYACYADEAEPLLDALCDRYGVEALRALADLQGDIADSALLKLRTRTPGLASLLDILLARAETAGAAERTPAGWWIAAGQADETTAGDIWNALVRDYPAHFAPALAAGRIGLHLPALLQGISSADDVASPLFSPRDLGSHLLAAPARQQLAQSLGSVLSDAQAGLPAGRRFRMLEIGAQAPLLGADCCALLDFTRADYCFATATETGLEAAAGRLAAHPDATLRLIGAASDAGPAAPEPVDLAIVQCNFDTLAQTRAALHDARSRLAPGGSLIVVGHHPAHWADFVFGVHDAWWSDASDGGRTSMQQAPAFWRHELQALGCACEAPLELSPGAIAGAYLLLARAGELTDAANADPDAPAAGRWLVLADDQGPGAALAATLTRELRDKGLSATHLGLDPAASPDTLPAIAQAEHYDHILHAAGLYGAGGDAQAACGSQARRCALAAAALRASEKHGRPATLWLLTAGARTPGDQPAAALRDLADAALCGYGRSIMNESAGTAVRLVDLPVAPEAAPVAALLRELTDPDAERELVLNAQGARYAPRLRVVARPLARVSAPVGATVRRLGFELPGQLRNLRWESHPARAPGDDELEIQVHATGLNFRDVMYTLGLLADEALENGYAGASLGLEFAGTVLRAGAGVTDFAPGDAVLGFGPASFSDRVLTTTTAVAAIPQGMSFEAAATIPSTFFTVYYALHHLARLAPGEKVLIHGAAGGVGIAAIQYAQWLGAEIYATAGSGEKRDFLRMMGVAHVFDSRSLSYADEIRALTEGRGVDVVLNSLSGEAIRRNLDVLAPFGRFLELGKRDFYEDTRIGLRPFRNNISYFGIDADQLLSARPELARSLYAQMMELFRDGALHPLPQRCFEARDVVDAFRYMQQSRQIGKIVVTYRNGLPEDAAPPARQTLALAADGSYLVSGGLSGFGLRTAQWLAGKGARHLVLAGRSGLASDEASAAVEALRARGVQVMAEACDVADAQAVEALLARARAAFPPLRGVVHAAAVIEDGLAAGASADRIARVLAPKMQGAAVLHELTRDDPLDLFVLFSSATTLFGNPGQSAYVAANAWMESLARQRQSLGLPVACARWGAIGDTGYLARNEAIKQALSHRMGGAALSAASALDALEDMLVSGASGLGVLELDWHALARHLPGAAAPRYADIARQAGESADDAGDPDDLLAQLDELDDAELGARVIEMLKQEVSEILRVPRDKIDPSRSLYDIGLDSLMGVELVVALEGRFGIRLPVMALSESPTLDKLSARLITALRGDSRPPAGDDIAAHIELVASQHATQVAPEHVDAIARRVRSGQAEAGQGMTQ
ncbi:SDR family NAD(P)-dependent oxidoreductase [Achromobacter sp. NPDC058515]|uniref:SDR family NAD(P)-dependent oxidoreductase n=1 Tax=Achromobacter sp. NPDC058515 TaxID=3346533 RepID=UPI0036518C3F